MSSRDKPNRHRVAAPADRLRPARRDRQCLSGPSSPGSIGSSDREVREILISATGYRRRSRRTGVLEPCTTAPETAAELSAFVNSSPATSRSVRGDTRDQISLISRASREIFPGIREPACLRSSFHAPNYPVSAQPLTRCSSGPGRAWNTPCPRSGRSRNSARYARNRGSSSLALHARGIVKALHEVVFPEIGINGRHPEQA
jgi:hypothetical protein